MYKATQALLIFLVLCLRYTHADCHGSNSSHACNTLWELLSCVDDLSVAQAVAVAPGVRFDRVLNDRNAWLTIFAAPDSTWMNFTGSGMSYNISSDGPHLTILQEEAVLDVLFMMLPGGYNIMQLANASMATQGGLQSGLSETLARQTQSNVAGGRLQWQGNKLAVMGFTNSSGPVPVFATPFVTASYAACNGWLHIVDEGWLASSYNTTLPADVANSIRMPVNQNPVVTYQPTCRDAGDPLHGPGSLDAFSLSVAHNSSDPDAIWSLLSTFLPAQSTNVRMLWTSDPKTCPEGGTELEDMAFTLFLPYSSMGNLGLTFADEDGMVRFMLNSMLPGVYCPWELNGTFRHNLLRPYAKDTGLAFGTSADGLGVTRWVSSASDGSVVSADGAGLHDIVSMATTCKAVVYFYDSEPGIRPVLMHNNSAALPPPELLWSTVADMTANRQRTPGACAQSLAVNLMAVRNISLMQDAAAPAAPPTASDGAGAQATSLGVGVIVGIVCAGVIFLVLSVLGFVSWRKRTWAAGNLGTSKDADMALQPAVKGTLPGEDTMPGSVCLSTVAVAPGSKDTDSTDLHSGWSTGEQHRAVAEHMQQALMSSAHQHLIPAADVRKLQSVGQGSFSIVYRGLWRGCPVALKQLRTDNMAGQHDERLRAELVDELKKEVTISAGLHHPHVLRFLGVVVDSPDQAPMLVMEYAERGSLYNVIAEARSNGGQSALPWQRRLSIALGAALGLEYLHSRDVLHGDFKSPNLLCGLAWTAKVADFGHSKVLQSDRSKTSTVDVNPSWRDPQAIATGQHSKAADVYSFAVVLYELLTLLQPWEGVPVCTIIFKVVTQHQRPPIPDNIREQLPNATGLDDYLALLEACWHRDPDERPDFPKIVQQLKAIAALPMTHCVPEQGGMRQTSGGV